MSMAEIWEYILQGGAALVLLLTLVEITPIKINPWRFLARKIGRAINGETLERLDTVAAELQRMKEKKEEDDILQCRLRILDFGDEILRGKKHTKEHFDHILIDISTYRNYCESHHGFANGVAVNTAAHIEKIYQERLEKNDFL
jgi:hypothetical protein